MGRRLLSPSRSVDHDQGRGFRRVLPRVGAVAAIVGGSVMVVHQVWDAREPGIEVGVVSSALHTTWVTLLFVAFAGLGALQRSAFGRLGRIGTVLAVAGSGGIAVLALFETFFRAVSPQSSGDDPPVVFLVLIFALMGCYIAGGLLFAWATMRARVLPLVGRCSADCRDAAEDVRVRSAPVYARSGGCGVHLVGDIRAGGSAVSTVSAVRAEQ